MWQFEHPSYLWALLLVPLIGLLFRLKQQATQRFVDLLGGPERTKRLIPGFNINKNKTILVQAYFKNDEGLFSLPSEVIETTIKYDYGTETTTTPTVETTSTPTVETTSTPTVETTTIPIPTPTPTPIPD